jgi:hypothetical protein
LKLLARLTPRHYSRNFKSVGLASSEKIHETDSLVIKKFFNACNYGKVPGLLKEEKISIHGPPADSKSSYRNRRADVQLFLQANAKLKKKKRRLMESLI